MQMHGPPTQDFHVNVKLQGGVGILVWVWLSFRLAVEDELEFSDSGRNNPGPYHTY